MKGWSSSGGSADPAGERRHRVTFVVVAASLAVWNCATSLAMAQTLAKHFPPQLAAFNFRRSVVGVLTSAIPRVGGRGGASVAMATSYSSLFVTRFIICVTNVALKFTGRSTGRRVVNGPVY